MTDDATGVRPLAANVAGLHERVREGSDPIVREGSDAVAETPLRLFIAEFLEAFPAASVLVTGVEDPDTRAHGANEGLHLAEFEKVLLAEALLLRNLG